MEQRTKTSEHQAQDEDLLIEACMHGDAVAWSEFIQRYGRLVYSIPVRMRLPPEACDDVFQNVFAIVVRELPRVRTRESIAKWLITTTRHETVRWVRQTRRSVPVQSPDLDDPPEADLLRLEQQQIVHEALDDLGGRCRDLLTSLFLDLDRPSYQDISQRLGIPVSAIGPTRNRCLQKLLRVIGTRLD